MSSSDYIFVAAPHGGETTTLFELHALGVPVVCGDSAAAHVRSHFIERDLNPSFGTAVGDTFL